MKNIVRKKKENVTQKKSALLKVKRTTQSKETEKEGGRETLVEQRIKYEKIIPCIEKKEETYELSLSYKDNKIVLMVKDPYWTHAYWEITPEKVEEVKDKIGKKSWTGIKYILRVYDITDIDFKGDNANRYFDIELTGYTNNWYIMIGVPDRTYCVDIGVLTADARFFMLARSNSVTTPRDTVSSVVDEEWMMTEEEYQNIFRLSGGLQRGAGSEDISRLLRKRMQEQISSGAISSISSPVGKVAKEKGFWLIVDAELIIYGATLPSATVTIQDKIVKLNPDGSFSWRFALPDGQQIIPVKAVSVDKTDERIITPIVNRETKR